MANFKIGLDTAADHWTGLYEGSAQSAGEGMPTIRCRTPGWLVRVIDSGLGAAVSPFTPRRRVKWVWRPDLGVELQAMRLHTGGWMNSSAGSSMHESGGTRSKSIDRTIRVTALSLI